MQLLNQIFSTIVILFMWVLMSAQESYIYVSDAGNWSNPPWKIMKYNLYGENPEVFIDDQMAWPQDILFSDDFGVVLISNLNSGQINKHDPNTGAYIGLFADGISGPTRMKIGPDNLIYVLQWSGDGKVRRYTQDGNFVDFFTSIGVPQSIGLDWDEGGNLYVSSYNGDSVRKFDQNGKDQGLFIEDHLEGPTNIWFDKDGDLLVVDYDGAAVKRFDADGVYKTNFLSGLSHAEGLDFLANGNILIGNGKTHSVKEFDANGNYIQDIISDGSGGLKTPNAVVIHTAVSSKVNLTEKLNYKITPVLGSIFLFEPETDYMDSIQCSIINSAGLIIDKFSFQGEQEWDGTRFPEGVYQVQLVGGNANQVKQIVIRY